MDNVDNSPSNVFYFPVKDKVDAEEALPSETKSITRKRRQKPKKNNVISFPVQNKQAGLPHREPAEDIMLRRSLDKITLALHSISLELTTMAERGDFDNSDFSFTDVISGGGVNLSMIFLATSLK